MIDKKKLDETLYRIERCEERSRLLVQLLYTQDGVIECSYKNTQDPMALIARNSNSDHLEIIKKIKFDLILIYDELIKISREIDKNELTKLRREIEESDSNIKN